MSVVDVLGKAGAKLDIPDELGRSGVHSSALPSQVGLQDVSTLDLFLRATRGSQS